MENLLNRVPEDVLPDSQETNRLLLSLAYSTGSITGALDMLKKLKSPPQNSSSQRNKIFTVVTRKDLSDSSITGSCSLIPMPEFSGKRYCHSVSESVFVPLNSRYPEIAFQLAAHTLSEQFQNEVAKISDNLPANRIVAENSRLTGNGADKLFFEEINNIHFPREIIDPLSTAVVLFGLKEFAGNRLSVDNFIQLLKAEDENIARRERAIENILANQQQF
jgi:hypothetical protein